MKIDLTIGSNPDLFNILNSLYKISGKISLVRRDAAVGTIQLHKILLRSPSIASVFASPTSANLAALNNKDFYGVNCYKCTT